MSTTYRPRLRTPPTYPRLSTPERPSSWSEHHAALILSLRDVSSPPTKTPDPDVRDFDVNRQIHARWTDPGIVDAMSRLRDSLPPKTQLSFNYGGRDVTKATWVLVYQTLPHSLPEVAYILWFHEYDDLDVEVGELSDVEWIVHIKKEDAVKEEEADVNVKKEVNVKLEHVEMRW